MNSSEALFVAWISHNGRTEGLARYLGIDALYVRSEWRPLPLRYLHQWVLTARALRARRPRVVLVMQPPVFALLPVVLYARGSGAAVVGDFHTGAFVAPKWRWSARLALRLLKPRGVAIVTNEVLARTTRRAGLRTLILHDLIEPLQPAAGDLDLPAALAPEAYVLVPLAYAHDEPLGAILEAARSMPDTTFVLTGTAPQWMQAAKPQNVLLTGFVSNEAFESLLRTAGAVLAATTEEHTMQRAGYEALSAGRPLVTTDTEVLREYFGDAAPHVPPTSEGIRDGLIRVLASRDDYLSRMSTLRDLKLSEQEASLHALRDVIEHAH